MRANGLIRGCLATCLLLASGLAFGQEVRFSEFHYDNTGTDVGEAIEVSGPAGTDLTGWSIVLYNGSNGAVYDTDTLSGTIPASCGTRGVVVLDYPSNGIQNGGTGATATDSPDAMALVNASGTVVEFLSYEGVLTGVGGPAAGQVSTDIGVREVGTEPTGLSLQRGPDGIWRAPAATTFGSCNDGDAQGPPVASISVDPENPTIVAGATLQMISTARSAGGVIIPGAPVTWASSVPAVATISASGLVTALAEGDTTITATASNGVAGATALHVNANTPPSDSPVRFNEIHYDNSGTDVGEAIEIEGPAGTDVTGYSIVLYNFTGGAVYNTRVLSGVIPATCGDRGVLSFDYPQDGIQNGPQDGFALIDNAGAVVEFRSYEGVLTAGNGPAAGRTSVDIGATEGSAGPGGSLQRNSANVWSAAPQTFGLCNPDTGGGANSVRFSGRFATDPPLPVGYQDQVFATLVDFNNQTIPSTFIFASETPAIASIDQNGVFTALAEGSAVLRATAADGTTGTITLPTRVAVESTTAQYGGNAEFGEPADGDASDDFIVRYPQYTASYNANRGTPNWVSYNLEATHFGDEDRCDCFTMDPALPASFPQITTADYTGAGAFHGYGIDRGHMVRSFDRTTGSLDNARTYLFDNIVPQAADLNQGPWSDFEFFLGDEARLNNREVYIVTGVTGNRGTLKNEGRVVIPTHTWKVAVLMPRDTGLNQIQDYRDLEVIAVNMPNDPGVRNVDWNTYLTTVDAIEAASGYDLLALLADDVETAVESNTQPPLASASGTTALDEGGSASFSAAASLDTNGAIVSYEWSFGDGSNGSGATVAHTFADDGVYTVTVTVTDNDGLTDTASLTVTVSNVAPVVGAIPDASVQVGDAYTVAGSFTDPGADTWTASVNFGDGSAPEQAMLSGHDFSLVHVYAAAGTYTVTVTVDDGDATASTTHTVTVNSPAASLSTALAMVDQLVANGKISRGLGRLLKAEITAAQELLDRGKTASAKTLLRGIVIELDLLVRWRVVKAADVAPLRAELVRVIDSLRR
jgi:DNA/RNA endonuclease G (NUC1)